MRSAMRDRRLRAIEVQTKCRVHLGKLAGSSSVIKGLPRRRLTIIGPAFTNICRAIEMMEAMFPRVMRFALYPYRLPATCDSRKFQSNRTFAHHYINAAPRQSGCIGLTVNIDDWSSWRKYLSPKKRGPCCGRSGIY
uniref:Lipase_3 domain-containing protein n=1 Tax=Mesocestoides corti TaxID=53468 RepID=A0A5K3F1R9_MESCO